MDTAKSGRAALNQRVAKLIARANDEEKLGLTVYNFVEILEKIDYNSENFARFKEGLENDHRLLFLQFKKKLTEKAV